MSKKKNENIKNEDANERFKRIANFRLKKLLYELNRIKRMTTQPNYTIYDTDAQRIVSVLTEEFESFLKAYNDIAENKTTATKKTEQKDIL